MFPPPSPSQSTINEKKTKTFIDLQEILLLLLLMLLSRCRTPPKPPARRHHVWTCRLRLSALPTGVLRRLHSAALATSVRVLDACNTLKTQIELELNSGWTQNTNDLLQTNEALNSIKPSNLRTDDLYDLQLYLNRLEQVKQKVQNKYSEQFAHGQLEDIISSTNLLDFGMIKQSLSSLQSMALESYKSADLANPNTHIFFLANYCTAQLFTRYVLPKHVTQLVNGPEFPKNSPGNSSTTQYTTSLSSISSNEPVLITSQSSPPPAILNSVPSSRC